MKYPIIVQYALTPNRHNVPILLNWDNQFISAKLRRISDKCWYDGHYFPNMTHDRNAVQHFQTEALGLKIVKRYELNVNGTIVVLWDENIASAHLQAKQKFGHFTPIHDVPNQIRLS